MSLDAAAGGRGYQTLYRKYRPQRFGDLIGQEHIVRTLQNAILRHKVAHAYLFSGPRGTGKTTTARILAKALNCERRPHDVEDPARVEPCNECPSCIDVDRDVSFDVAEIDAASNRGIDDIRHIAERAQQAASAPSRNRVFIIDEVHQLSRDGASAFLKTLEEPPANVIFVLATTDPERMISTILSRCQRFDFRPVPAAVVSARLAEICEAEAINAETAALDAIARRARGGVRDALSALEQARALCDDDIGADDVAAIFGGLDAEDLARTVEAIAEGDAGGALRHVDALVDRGIDVRVFTRELADYVRDVFVVAAAPDVPDLVDATEHDYERIRELARAMGPALATRTLTVLGQVLVQFPQSLSPRNELDAALVQLAHSEADPQVGALAARVDSLERRLRTAGHNVASVTGGEPEPHAVEAPADTDEDESEGAGDPAAPASDTASAVAPAETDSETEPPAPAVAPDAADDAAPDEETSAPAGAETVDVTLADVERQWPAIVAGLGEHTKVVQAYFRQGQATDVVDGFVHLVFPSEFFVESIARDESQAAFAAVTEHVIGTRLGVVGHVDDDEDVGSASTQAEPKQQQSVARSAPSAPADVETQPDPEPDEDADTALDETDHTESVTRSVLDLVTTEMDAEVVDERDSF